MECLKNHPCPSLKKGGEFLELVEGNHPCQPNQVRDRLNDKKEGSLGSTYGGSFSEKLGRHLLSPYYPLCASEENQEITYTIHQIPLFNWHKIHNARKFTGITSASLFC
jgi:hypothetical protein